MIVLNQDESTENGGEDTNQDGSIENDTDLEDLFDEDNYIKGPNIGRKLDKLTRSRKGKLPLVIEPGMTRPSSLTIAAKFATECNIAIRTSVPIFPHWKEYKHISKRKLIKAFIDRVCSKFEADKKSVHVKRVCLAMLKNGVRQQRYKLKKKYFDAFPLHQVPKKSPVPSSMSDAQWDTLVEFWKSENKMMNCEKNKENRSKVQFHQATGSRSYEMQLVALANKYQNEPPNALDKFKDLHYSKKKGFAPAVQTAIVEIEGNLTAPVPDGEEPKDVDDVVAEVLRQKTKKKNSFLVNVGLESLSASEEDIAESQRLQAELEMEKETSNELREILKTQQQQIDDMAKKFHESEIARTQRDEENKALIMGLMSMIPTNQPTR